MSNPNTGPQNPNPNTNLAPGRLDLDAFSADSVEAFREWQHGGLAEYQDAAMATFPPGDRAYAKSPAGQQALNEARQRAFERIDAEIEAIADRRIDKDAHPEAHWQILRMLKRTSVANMSDKEWEEGLDERDLRSAQVLGQERDQGGKGKRKPKTDMSHTSGRSLVESVVNTTYEAEAVRAQGPRPVQRNWDYWHEVPDENGKMQWKLRAPIDHPEVQQKTAEKKREADLAEYRKKLAEFSVKHRQQSKKGRNAYELGTELSKLRLQYLVAVNNKYFVAIEEQRRLARDEAELEDFANQLVLEEHRAFVQEETDYMKAHNLHGHYREQEMSQGKRFLYMSAALGAGFAAVRLGGVLDGTGIFKNLIAAGGSGLGSAGLGIKAAGGVLSAEGGTIDQKVAGTDIIIKKPVDRRAALALKDQEILKARLEEVDEDVSTKNNFAARTRIMFELINGRMEADSKRNRKYALVAAGVGIAAFGGGTLVGDVVKPPIDGLIYE